MRPARPDLLAYLETWRQPPHRELRRVERWRRRGLPGPAVARLADQVAGELHRAGIKPGDRVGLALHDGPLWVAGFFGVLRLGGVVVPLDTSLPSDILRQAAGELQLSAWCTEPEAADLDLPLPRIGLDWDQARPAPVAEHELPPWPATDPERLAQIVLTSGTSALPKAVPISHRNLRVVLDALAGEIYRHRRFLRLLPPPRLAVALPLSHLYGQVMGLFLPCLLQAHTAMLPAVQGAELAGLLRREGAWVLATVPRSLGLLARYLRSAGEDRWGREGFAARLTRAGELRWYRRALLFAPLRRLLGARLVAITCGGAALDLELEEFWRRLGYVVVQGYGLTEAAPLVTMNDPLQTSPGSLGKPLPGVEVRIADDSEILVRGANVAAARLDGSAVDHQGWLHTGDLGRRDATGNLFYLGRKGERIITPAGLNVDPEPIAEALRRQPGISDALILERPWGAPGIVAAVLLAQPGTDVGNAVRAVNRDLPDAARIRSWHPWPAADFPRTHTGKAKRSLIHPWLELQAPAGHRQPETGAAPGPLDLADPAAALLGMIGEITGDGGGERSTDTLLLDALTSLDRVELATMLESNYGIGLSEAAFAGERTLEQLAGDITAELAHESTRAPATPPADPATGTARLPAATRSSSVPTAAWRNSVPARIGRLLLRETIMRPLVASLISARATGTEHLAELEPPYLLAANHLSLMDPPALIFALPWRQRGRIAPAARWEHFSERRGGWLQYRAAVLGLNLIPLVQVGDWRPTLQIAGELVDRGYCPLIYPEGKRSLDGRLHQFQLGIAVIAQNLHLPIVPCGVAGLLRVLPLGAHWPRTPWPRRAPVAVAVGEPLPPPGPGANLQGTVAELQQRIELLHARAVAMTGCQ